MHRSLELHRSLRKIHVKVEHRGTTHNSPTKNLKKNYEEVRKISRNCIRVIFQTLLLLGEMWIITSAVRGAVATEVKEQRPGLFNMQYLLRACHNFMCIVRIKAEKWCIKSGAINSGVVTSFHILHATYGVLHNTRAHHAPTHNFAWLRRLITNCDKQRFVNFCSFVCVLCTRWIN